MLRDLPLDDAYVTGSGSLLASFYLPCLSVATKYDRAVGYFRSSLFVVAGIAFSDFARRGGRARIICSHEIDRDDANAIERGIGWKANVERQIDVALARMLSNPEDAPVVAFLATLVATGALELRVAVRPDSPGIFHDKVGIFRDSTNDAVSFVGSANETLSAWDPRLNHEGFEVFASWNLGHDANRAQRHIEYFERLWAGTHSGIATLDLTEAARRELLRFEDHEGLESAALRVRRHLRPGDDAEAEGRTAPRTSSAPARRRLQEHQQAAVANWERAGNRGIITHVTGAGKTISALEIVRRWTRTGRPALILVPGEVLLEQWRTEINRDFGESEVQTLVVGGSSGRRRWEAQVGDFSRPAPALGPRITLATMQSAASDVFLNRLHAGRHLLVVGDEVHRLGAPSFRPLFKLDPGGRLGLSATPERYGDPSGSSEIFRFFGAALEPIVDIGEAVRLERLVPYDYFVHRVSLTDEERKKWDSLTDEIAHAFASLSRDDQGMPNYSDRYRLLLIRRAGIVKQAASKVALARDVLSVEYRPGDRWLVYCDDSAQLRSVSAEVRAAGLPVHEYHSAMAGSREATMTAFATHGGVLIAIKCLDEGVDIPTVNRALILASSSNPREFIQRRGRVLRSAPGKFSAAIHDALVLPEPTSEGSNEGTPAFVRTDLARAVQFAKHARNTAVFAQLSLLASEFGLQARDLAGESFENEEE